MSEMDFACKVMIEHCKIFVSLTILFYHQVDNGQMCAGHQY